MQTTPQLDRNESGGSLALILGLCVAGASLVGAETNAPPATVSPPMTPEQMFSGGTNSLNNWIEVSAGSFLTGGNRSSFEQQQQHTGGAFGGIEGFHVETNLDKTTTLTLDGRGIFDQHDYNLKLGVERDKLGYLRLSYNEFRTWSDGDGGFFPPTGTFYPLSGSALGLDRGAFSVEAGLTPEKGINAIFKYTHTFREGEESSTIWGDAHPGNTAVTQGLSPSFSDIHEHADNLQLDLSDHLGKTDLGLGLHYETGKLGDALMISQYPGEPIQQKITDQQGTSYGVFDVHTFTETWIKTNFMLSSGFAYSHSDNTFTGSRIYGSEFDASYSPNSAYGFGYFDLSGKSHMNEYVADVNLFYQPTPFLTVTPSFRVQEDLLGTESIGIETLGANAPAPFASDGGSSDLDVRERLDVAYRGFTNWVLHARVDLTEADGDLNQYGGLIPISGIGVPTVQSAIEDRNFIQKYAAGTRWYASRRVILDLGGYYKQDDYHYTSSEANTNDLGGYPGYLEMQKLVTYDGNIRLTLRLPHDVSLISHYDYQWATIHTAPNALAGLPDVESSAMRSHIIAQDGTWIPWSRLNLQAGINYVISDTSTPASDVTQAILDARNNYWTVNFSSGLVLDNKTDLTVSYVYYRADDYSDNAPEGVPYGAGGQEHSVTATVARRITERVRLSVKYGYFRYIDQATGGNADFGASLIYATLRFRF